jgi:hypothetical protein
MDLKMHFRWQWIGVQMENNVDKTMYVGIVYNNPLGVGYLCRVIKISLLTIGTCLGVCNNSR